MASGSIEEYWTRPPAPVPDLDAFDDQDRVAAGRVRGRPKVFAMRGDRSRLVVGDGVVFGEGVEIWLGGNHRTDWVTTFPIREIFDLPGAYEAQPWSHGDIRIGNGCVIGARARVLAGVEVGAGAVVRDGAVVTRHVSPGAVVAGNPARETGDRPGPARARSRFERVRGRRQAADADPAGPPPGMEPAPRQLATRSYFEPITWRTTVVTPCS